MSESVRGMDLTPRVSQVAEWAITLGTLSVGALIVMPGAGIPLGAAAVILGLVSRRQLKADLLLRGSRFSLAGFVLGIIGLVLGGAVPLLLMIAARAFGWYD